MADELSHVDAQGRLRMVDISEKKRTLRTASASGRVRMKPSTVAAIATGDVPKGDVLTCAKIAGIQAAKRTAALIPLCHPIDLTWIDVTFQPGADEIGIDATARAADATGVEMEALTAVTVAALTIYDMCKAVDRDMVIDNVRLLSKTGGKSDYAAGGGDRG